MLISSGTGMVLEKFVKKYEGFALMAVVISGSSLAFLFNHGPYLTHMPLLGLPGSVGAVSISRLSTLLHASESLPERKSLFRGSASHISPPDGYRPYLTAATLFVVTAPVQFTFLGIVYATGWMDLPFLFAGAFVGFFCISVCHSMCERCIRDESRLTTFHAGFRFTYTGTFLNTMGVPIRSACYHLL